jgi:glucose/arabinose dehydrogenase
MNYQDFDLHVETLEQRNMLSSVQVFAAGTTGEESLELLVNDVVVATWQLNDSAYQNVFESKAYQTPKPVSLGQIKLRFSNDLYDVDQGIDRNVRIDAIVIDGVQTEIESEQVYSTGTWLPEDGIQPGFRRSEFLHANGEFSFPNATTPETTVRVVARGDEGDETFSLSIDGVEVQTWEQIGTELTEFTFQIDANVSPDDVRITFENDLYDPDAGVDRNLIVDRIEINAAIFQTEDSSVYSTGTWLPADGVAPGFRQSEYLHAAGYFQFASQSSGSFALESGSLIFNENAAAAVVVVNRLNGSAGESTIDYETFDITAIAGQDYESTQGTLVFADGETSKEILIPILADTIVEDGEQFSLVIDNPVNAGLLSPRTVTIEIGNDSGPVDPGEGELDVTTEILIDDMPGAVTIDWLPDGTMIVADIGGAVYVKEDGQSVYANELLNIADQVNGPRGMTAMRLHPDLANNPYLYLGYAYDPPEVFDNVGLAGPDGNGNRASRLVRYTLDAATNYRTVVADSEFILLGSNSTWDNFNAFVDSTVDMDEPAAGINPDETNLRDFLAADSQSHTIGDIECGTDGALYVSNGDGASYNDADPRAIRVQDIDNLSGKVLRIDPLTGQGLSDNPFYDADPESNRSKVYQYGFRNPFRITLDSSGQLFVGDVGWYKSEEVNTGPAGSNFGWPYFEGDQQTPLYNLLPEAIAFYNSGAQVESPLVNLDHVEDSIDAIILGDFIDSGNFPAEYDGHLIFSHLASGLVRAVEFDAAGAVVEIKTLFEGSPFMTEVTFGPDGDLYFVDFGGMKVGRWTIVV